MPSVSPAWKVRTISCTSPHLQQPFELSAYTALSLYSSVIDPMHMSPARGQLIRRYIHAKTGRRYSAVQLLRYFCSLTRGTTRFRSESVKSHYSSRTLIRPARLSAATLPHPAFNRAVISTSSAAGPSLVSSVLPPHSAVSPSTVTAKSLPRIPVSLSSRRLAANISVLHSTVAPPPLAPCWGSSSPVSGSPSGSPSVPISRRWPLPLLKCPNDDPAPVTPVDQIMHTPVEPPDAGRTPLRRPRILSPVTTTPYADVVPCSPLVSSTLYKAVSDMSPVPVEDETSQPSLAPSLCSPFATAVRSHARPPLRLNMSLRPPLSAPGTSPAAGIPSMSRLREQPLRMGIARRLSYNHHNASPPTPPMGSAGGEADAPSLASPLVITPLRPPPPSPPVTVKPEQQPLGTLAGVPAPADGAGYFDIL